MTHYHPSVEMLTDYAAGSLPLTHALCVSTHIEHCHECQQQLRKLEILGSHLFDDVPTEPRRLDHLKQSVLAKLNESDPVSESVSKESTESKLDAFLEDYSVPKSLRQFVKKSYDQLSWTRLSPSFKIATLYNEEGGAQVALTRVKAGAHMPSHTHTGDEITLVLEGAFSDEAGIYRKGDFIQRGANHKHKPIVTKDAECICLTVLDAPIEFTGWFTRLLNPLIRRHHPFTRVEG